MWSCILQLVHKFEKLTLQARKNINIYNKYAFKTDTSQSAVNINIPNAVLDTPTAEGL